jgi:tRNA A-37 threonylcarbamoyl transferase component Bud32
MANSPARSAIDIGTVIDGTYQIEALVGRGGMGAVFLASHLRLPGKQVAIKFLHAELAYDEVLARFRREAHISSELNHPNIVTVHDTNSLADGTPYLVMEYLEGENLAAKIARGPMPIIEVLPIVRQIAAALAASHEAGIVHRDLKPQNIFLTPTEVAGLKVEHVKVLDFGISKMRASQTVKTQDSAMLGTPQYMAPEQATGKHAEVDQRTDIFALGAIIYEMLCGQPAFIGLSVPEVVFKVVYEEPPPLADRVPGLDPTVAGVVTRALAKKPDDRFSSVGELVEALTGKPVSLIRTPRAKSGAGGGPGSLGGAARTGGGVRTTARDEAFAATVGSGDHGAPPLAVAATVASGDHGASPLGVAETAASGDHRDSRVSAARTGAGVDVGGATMAATAPPAPPAPAGPSPAAPPVTPTPAPVPASRTGLAIVVVGLVAAAAIAVVVVVAMRGGNKKPKVAAAVTSDAAVSPTTPSTAADAATAVPTAVPIATPDAAVAMPPETPDAAPAGKRPDARGAGARPRPDAATAAAANPEADRLFEAGLTNLEKGDAGKAMERGHRLADQHRDPRGWLLVGLGACEGKKYDALAQARRKLKGSPGLLAQLKARCKLGPAAE